MHHRPARHRDRWRSRHGRLDRLGASLRESTKAPAMVAGLAFSCAATSGAGPGSPTSPMILEETAMLHAACPSLFARPGRTTKPRRRSRRHPSLESLEGRLVLSTLIVNPSNPSDYAQIGAAVAAASPGDTIRVYPGTYTPFTVATNNLTITAALPRSSPIVDATGATYGVVLSASGVTIAGLTVENAVRGFYVTGSNDVLSGNTAEDNTFIGFEVYFASQDVLSGNRAENNGDLGFDIHECSQTTLVGNYSAGNADTGYEALYGTSNVFLFNRSSGNGDVGFFFIEESQDTSTGDSSQADAYAGFYVSDSNPTMSLDSAVNDGSVGFYLTGSEATVQYSVASGCGQDGFLDSQGIAVLKFDLASNNPGIGFELNGALNSTVTNCLAIGNSGDGFRVDVYSIVLGQYDFYYVDPSTNNTLSFNLASNNGGNGFFVLGSTENTLSNNLATNNGGNGFSVEGEALYDDITGAYYETVYSTSNTVQNNTADNNAGWGFYVDVLDSNVFTNNQARHNGLGDFNL